MDFIDYLTYHTDVEFRNVWGWGSCSERSLEDDLLSCVGSCMQKFPRFPKKYAIHAHGSGKWGSLSQHDF